MNNSWIKTMKLTKNENWDGCGEERKVLGCLFYIGSILHNNAPQPQPQPQLSHVQVRALRHLVEGTQKQVCIVIQYTQRTSVLTGLDHRTPLCPTQLSGTIVLRDLHFLSVSVLVAAVTTATGHCLRLRWKVYTGANLWKYGTLWLWLYYCDVNIRYRYGHGWRFRYIPILILWRLLMTWWLHVIGLSPWHPKRKVAELVVFPRIYCRYTFSLRQMRARVLVAT